MGIKGSWDRTSDVKVSKSNNENIFGKDCQRCKNTGKMWVGYSEDAVPCACQDDPNSKFNRSKQREL